MEGVDSSRNWHVWRLGLNAIAVVQHFCLRLVVCAYRERSGHMLFLHINFVVSGYGESSHADVSYIDVSFKHKWHRVICLL